ncbi:MAG TPA: DUF1549 domain-containing protein, partial [Planctomycetota bacterium]|nr:DUF1549 domain-containing protein [Planctomycetota bacterium]
MQLRVLSALLVIAWAGAGVPAQTAELPWSFRPLATAEPPAASDPLWTDPIDRFVLATLHARGLQPNPPADKRTLLRRASQVLTGLPPTRAEVLEFQADDRADAFARVIDRLQASPHYGEHQARLWLDLARYSDSNGLDENLAYAEAFRYRDWVVRAGNADLPYDEFGTLQIAGDLLPADAPAALADRLQATAFLALGPKMLAEQDKDKLVLDVVDEQLDLVGRTFLGLTLGCARCHDHKFDPISQRDYYALAGIFKSTRTLANLDHVSQWLERELASDDQIALRQQREKDLAAAEQTLRQAQDAAATQQRRALVQDAGRYLLAAQQALGDAHFVEAGAAVRTSLHRDQDHWGTKACVVLHTHQAGPQFAEWAIDVGQAGSYRLEVHYATKESRPMRVLVDGQEVIGRALAEVTGDWFPAQQRWFTAGEVTLHAGSNLLRL